MSQSRILIVEDDPIIAMDLSSSLDEAGYLVIGKADNASGALELINEHNPDLVLLDISLEGDLDGIDLAHKINSTHEVPFIFLTSFYDQKTLNRAKVTEPAAYIVKPFDEKELKTNIEVALYKKNKKATASLQAPTEKLFFRRDQELIPIDPMEIIMAEAYDNYTYLYTEETKELISHTLKSIEGKLSPYGFIRVHKSHLINFQKITSISEGYIFIDQHKVPMGNAYKQDFMNRLEML